MQEVLQQVDLIACEDTRHTGRLLAHWNIRTRMTSCYRENEQHKVPALIAQLLAGQNLALVSDAGTPGLSDPGAVVVRAARQAGIPVLAVAGPSALAAALSVAGLEEADFYFGGFLKAKASQRRSQLRQLKSLSCPLVFYEAPHRIAAMLEDCLTILGDRPTQVFRELTKLHEEHLLGSTSELLQDLQGKVRGELVVILKGRPEQSSEGLPDNLEDLLRWYQGQGFSLKESVQQLARDLDLPRSQVYQQALQLWTS
jgi:16S rRNA (cytidine1402-2'-O)-methyltransferase